MPYSCNTCDKHFNAFESLEQHMKATGHISCHTCGKLFNAFDSLLQHENSTGHTSSTNSKKKKHKKKSKKPRLPDAPFPDADGEWVQPEEFSGKKSFGYFTCDCSACWTSAHAYVQYRQECKTCNSSSHASLFWVNNFNNYDKQSNSQDEESKPHMRHLCEACRLGVCDMSENSSSFRYDY